jgi:hypothetical protein
MHDNHLLLSLPLFPAHGTCTSMFRKKQKSSAFMLTDQGDCWMEAAMWLSCSEVRNQTFMESRFMKAKMANSGSSTNVRGPGG